MDVADRIEASGLKDRELAERSGLHLATINRYRRRLLRPLKPDHIQRLARALDCSPAEVAPEFAAMFRDNGCRSKRRKKTRSAA